MLYMYVVMSVSITKTTKRFWYILLKEVSALLEIILLVAQWESLMKLSGLH